MAFQREGFELGEKVIIRNHRGEAIEGIVKDFTSRPVRYPFTIVDAKHNAYARRAEQLEKVI